MARYLTCRRAEGFAVVSAQTGCIAVANGRLLEELDEDEADDFVDMINCVEGEALHDADEAGDLPEIVAAPLYHDAVLVPRTF